MRLLRRALTFLVAALAAAGVLAVPSVASAAPRPGAVYALSNPTTSNAVIEYARAANGALTLRNTYPTGALGTGSGLGSQGAVVLDETASYLYAVNAGSDSITSFRVRPRGLEVVGTVASGGLRPTSITVHRGLLYVLNAGDPGTISGFTVHQGVLTPIANSTRPLSGAGTNPAQVSFTPDGRQLVVTERATNQLDLYSVDGAGLASAPTVVPSAGQTPFGFEFDARGHLIVSEAFGGEIDASAVSSYDVGTGTLQVVSPSVPTTETAACWIATTENGRYAYAGNTGSNSISGYRVGNGGSLTLLTPDGRTGVAAGAVTDLAMSAGSRFLYARLGDGTVGAYQVRPDGSLEMLAPAPGLPTGAVGLAAF